MHALQLQLAARRRGLDREQNAKAQRRRICSKTGPGEKEILRWMCNDENNNWNKGELHGDKFEINKFGSGSFAQVDPNGVPEIG